MKFWKYKIVNRANVGTEENPLWHEAFYEKRIPCTEENEKIAKGEAYNGEYEVYDDGRPEPVVQPTDAERIAELEEALELLLSGVTE